MNAEVKEITTCQIVHLSLPNALSSSIARREAGSQEDLGKAHKIVQQAGLWFKYDGTHLGQGKEKARNFLIENPDVCEEIRMKILAAGGYVEDIAEVLEDIEKEAKEHKPKED